MEHRRDPVVSSRADSRSLQRKATGGFALMAALCFLVIITILVLAFFTSVSREHTTTKIYSSGVNAKFLSDAAVNLVMGQITAATQGTQPGVQGRFTWASQPGMIRTYSDQDQDTDVADNCYKLYSSSAMIVPGSTIAAQASQDVPAGWNTEPALYTDLNAPVVDSTGATNFPIVDGNGLTTMTVNGAQVLTYDTNGDGVPDVEGFSIPLSSVPTYSAGSPVSATNNPAPMPVQWLYILKDGTITSPDSVSDKTVHWTGTSTNKAPTPSNPIVGRMAFWTDDETSKLNINTASEGDFYGPSYTISPTDNQFANGSKEYGLYMAPPATGEYNRYPGHPATTCLSVALGTWVGNLNTSTSPAAPTAYTSSSNDAAYVQSLQQYLQFPGGLLPQYNFGGSQAGTINIQDKNYNIVAANTSRLFSSVDELIFSPSRSAFPGLNKNIVQKMKFFLTASSRAPELTPFNTPKVSVWPQWMNAQDRSASAGTALGSLSSNYASLDSYFAADVTYSRVLAACSSFGTNASSPSGKNEYFFQRYARGTGTNSSNSKVGSWADTYSDWDKVPRNQQLANYLCTMGAQSIPGYGAALSGNKYTARNFSQIVLETLDYIRSNVDRMGYLTADDNVVDPVLTDGSGVNIRVFNAYIPPLLVTGGTLLPGMTDSNDVLKGFGFYPIPVQFGFLQGGNTATDQQAVLGVELFLPADPTPAPLYPVGATIENAKQIQFANPLTTDPWYQFLWKYAELQGGGESNMARFFWTWAAHNTYTNAPFFPVQGTSPNQTITMGSGPITLDLWPSVTSTAIPTTGPATPPGRASPYVQKITLEFPTVSQIPMPTTPFNNLSGSVGVPPNLNVTAPPTPPAGSPPTPMPTPIAVRSMVLNALNNTYAGDWRVLGALYNIDDSVNEAKGNVAAQIFVPSPNYTTTASESHSFRMRGFEDVGNNQQQPYSLTSDPTATAPTTSTSGSLISALDGAKYSDSNAPLVAQSQTAALNSLGYPGDWDTGPDENPDGPYINALKQTPVDLDFYGSTVNGDESSAFSPNSLIASPVQFGSLPTGVYPQSWSAANPRAEPWQTLLFCPNPAARVDVSSTTLAKDLPGSAGVEHRGFLNPPIISISNFSLCR